MNKFTFPGSDTFPSRARFQEPGLFAGLCFETDMKMIRGKKKNLKTVWVTNETSPDAGNENNVPQIINVSVPKQQGSTMGASAPACCV